MFSSHAVSHNIILNKYWPGRSWNISFWWTAKRVIFFQEIFPKCAAMRENIILPTWASYRPPNDVCLQEPTLYLIVMHVYYFIITLYLIVMHVYYLIITLYLIIIHNLLCFIVFVPIISFTSLHMFTFCLMSSTLVSCHITVQSSRWWAFGRNRLYNCQLNQSNQYTFMYSSSSWALFRKCGLYTYLMTMLYYLTILFFFSGGGGGGVGTLSRVYLGNIRTYNNDSFLSFVHLKPFKS